MPGSGAALVLSATMFAAAGSLAQSPQTASQIDKPVIYQIGDYLHINAAGPRPLLQAIDALQRKYGWVIDYEDPQYTTAPENPASRPSPPHRLHSMAQTAGNASGAFSLRFQLAEQGNAVPDEAKLLTALVNAYNDSNGAAEFKLLQQAGDRFAVVGVGVRDANGNVVSQHPILDLPITLAKAQKGAAEAISLISRQVSAESKIAISVHFDPALPQSTTAMIGGQDLPARQLLLAAVGVLGSKAYWRLLYEPQNKAYELNIRQLPR